MTHGRHTLFVVGAGSGSPGLLTAQARQAIAGCRVFAGAARLLRLADDLAPGAESTHAIGADFEEARDFIAGHLEQADVCVLTSGDPGCYSILSYLMKHFKDRIRVLPGISSVQLMSARLRLPWQDWRLISLHGRAAEASGEPPSGPVLYFCDESNPPQAIAGRLLDTMPDCEAAVGAFLGEEEELVREGSLREIAAGVFPGHSLLLVRPSAQGSPGENRKADAPLGGAPDERIPSPAPAPGIPDGLWLRAAGIPLSKSEIRAVMLSRARPAGRRVIWDIGTGTGSYGVECSLLEPAAQVIAVDRDPAACHLAAANASRFGARVEVVCAEAPEGLETLATPDLVIIGGNGGMLAPIFKTAVRALAPGGRIVVTALLQKTKEIAHQQFGQSDLKHLTATRVTVARRTKDNWQKQNPVIIFTGDKPVPGA